VKVKVSCLSFQNFLATAHPNLRPPAAIGSHPTATRAAGKKRPLFIEIRHVIALSGVLTPGFSREDSAKLVSRPTLRGLRLAQAQAQPTPGSRNRGERMKAQLLS